MKKTLFSLVAVLSLAGAAFADQTPDHKALVLKNKDGAAILGYDAVAYFTDNKPAKGNPKFQSEYEGANFGGIQSVVQREPREVCARLRRLLRLRGKH